MRRVTRYLTVWMAFALATVVGAPSLALAQVPPPPPSPLDPMREDVGPLSTSLRETEAGLRLPTGFQNVYRVPGRDDLLMRMDGGMVAIFPRSTYNRGKEGTNATVPPGTTFYIGVPAEWFFDHSSDEVSRSHPNRVRGRLNSGLNLLMARPSDLRAVDTEVWHTEQRAVSRSLPVRLPDQSLSSTPPRMIDSTGASTIVNDGQYRERRIDELLHRAIQASSSVSD